MKDKSTKNMSVNDILPVLLTSTMLIMFMIQIAPVRTSYAIEVIPAGPENQLNLGKAVVGAAGEVHKVGSDELVTYCICFDGNKIVQPVTNVSVIDILPKHVSFVKADGDDIIGHYDDVTHIYTWSYPFISPGQVVRLEITVKVNPDVAPGKTITNIVSIDSEQTPSSTASVDIVTSEALPTVGKLQIIPERLSRGGTLTAVTAVMELPEGIAITDVKDEPLVLQPGNIFANEQFLSEAGGRTVIIAVFDKAALMNAVPEDYLGPFDFEALGKFVSGQSFSGEATITITPVEDLSDISYYVTNIDISQIWDYDDPTKGNDLMYEFQLEISARGHNSVNMNANILDIEFLTPAGNLFQIPKLPGQWSNGIWTSYEYNPDLEEARWQYRARSANPADLQAYGDGEYTITLNYLLGGRDQTKAWFGIPGTQVPIPQPTQEPVLTFPLYRQTVGTPVTFMWEPCTDKSTGEIRIDAQEKNAGTFTSNTVGVDQTGWGPIYLTDGVWQTELIFQQRVSNIINDDGIKVNLWKQSKSNSEFTLAGYPHSTYEIWGGDTFIGLHDGMYVGGGYGNVGQLQANGYVKLGESDGQTATFTGNYRYYLIATRGEIQLDCIQGSDGTYYSSFEPNVGWANITDPNNLLGPPDGKFATIGGNHLWDEFSGYIAFTNPNNWTELTTTTVNIFNDLEVKEISIIPETIRRDGTLTNILFVLKLPEGIGVNQIGEEPIVLQPGDIEAKDQMVHDTDGRTTIIAIFDKAALLDAVPGYGPVNFEVAGKLASGHNFFGQATMTITRFAGN